MTEQNLKNAFSGESQAHIRYLLFGDIAEREGFRNVARLFRAIAYAETIHASGHFNNLAYLNGGYITIGMAGFGPGKTLKNLGIAIEGETFEIEEMYPVYKDTARFQDEKGAERSFDWAYQTEQIHAKMFKKAKEAVNHGKDVDIGEIQICSVCGHTVEGSAPEKCPLCGASREKYKAFT
jgi:rubrerythrin